jgi:hypothetical protein
LLERLQAKFGDKVLEFAKDVVNPVAKIVPEAVHVEKSN